jgi:hypothetical protein
MRPRAYFTEIVPLGDRAIGSLNLSFNHEDMKLFRHSFPDCFPDISLGFLQSCLSFFAGHSGFENYEGNGNAPAGGLQGVDSGFAI